MIKKVFKVKKREKVERNNYIVLNRENTVQRNIECEKKDISELMNKLNTIKEAFGDFSRSYENLTEEEVSVLFYGGDMKFDLENNTMKVGYIEREDLALVDLATI